MLVTGNNGVDYYVGTDGRSYELKLHNNTITFMVANHVEVGEKTFPATKGVFAIANGTAYDYSKRQGDMSQWEHLGQEADINWKVIA